MGEAAAVLESTGIPDGALPYLAAHELTTRSFRRSYSSFFMANEPGDHYTYGKHTRALIRIYQRGMDRLEAGESTYVIVNVPPQHGKSDVVSRCGPAWTILRRPESKIILATYGQDLATDFSISARRTFNRWAGPMNVQKRRKKGEGDRADERDQVATWGTYKGGYVRAVGIRGTATGRTGEVIIIDDPYKDRTEADSPTISRKVWESFGHVFMPRRAPVHFIIIVMNRWNEHDLCGRIMAANDPTSPDYDEKLPVFEVVSFPAQEEGGDYLFPERYNRAFYESARAFAGEYGWSSQYQQNPTPRTGNFFKISRIVELEPEEWEQQTKDLVFEWGLDLASTEKERLSDDPDYTHGSDAAVDLTSNVPKVYLREVFRTRETALDRNRTVKRHVVRAHSDRMRVESVAGYKDAYITLKHELDGILTVSKVNVTTSLFVRAGVLEPVVDAGNLFVPKGAPWLKEWRDEFRAFPDPTSHDDGVASLLASVYDRLRGARMKIEI